MKFRTPVFAAAFALFPALFACAGDPNDPPVEGTGGVATGGSSTGGTSSGGSSTGGSFLTGGAGTGGALQTGGSLGSGGASTGGGTGTGGDGTGGAGMCADPDAATGIAPTFTMIKAMMVASPNGRCSSSDCHGVTDVHPEKLVLEDNEGLLERMKTHVATRCNDLVVVVPGDPENSALVRALRGDCTDAEGVVLPRMPGGCMEYPDCNCFYPSWMEAVETWIAEGAQDN